MATKVFDMGIMACEDVQAWNKSIKFGTGNDTAFVPAVVNDGAFVTLGGLAADAVYAGKKDWNVQMAYAPTTDELTADKVYVVDLSEVTAGIIAGNTYKIGTKQVDLSLAAGYPARARALHAGDKFWLGAGNFETTPTVGQYAELTANKTTLTPAASATAGQINFKILDSKPMTIGNLVNYSGSAFEQEYLVEVQ